MTLPPRGRTSWAFGCLIGQGRDLFPGFEKILWPGSSRIRCLADRRGRPGTYRLTMSRTAELAAMVLISCGKRCQRGRHRAFPHRLSSRPAPLPDSGVSFCLHGQAGRPSSLDARYTFRSPLTLRKAGQSASAVRLESHVTRASSEPPHRSVVLALQLLAFYRAVFSPSS
jgi:hypothetical protein